MSCPLCRDMGRLAHLLCRVFEAQGWLMEKRRTWFANVTGDDE